MCYDLLKLCLVHLLPCQLEKRNDKGRKLTKREKKALEYQNGICCYGGGTWVETPFCALIKHAT